MNYLNYIFQFLATIINALRQLTVPGFDFTFWDFAVGSFMLASGIAFIRYMMGIKRTEEQGENK